jgi:hypothetical protein
VPAGTYYVVAVVTSPAGEAYEYASGAITIQAEPTDGTRVYVEPAEQTVSIGDSLSIAINIEAVTGLAGFQLDLDYNPAVLEALAIEEDPFLPSSGGTFCLDELINKTTGTITNIACAKTDTGGVNGGGTLAIITFNAVGAGTSDIVLRNIALSDLSGQLIPYTVAHGRVMVTEYPSWDVNRDGKVDIIDLVLVGQRFGQDIPTSLEHNPDVNGDGKVDILDLILVGVHFGEVYP